MDNRDGIMGMGNMVIFNDIYMILDDMNMNDSSRLITVMAVSFCV